MKRSIKLLVLPALLLLSACNDDSDSGSSSPALTVEELPAGVYTISTGDMNAPTVGKYYADDSGNRLLVLNDSSDHASQVYQQQSSNPWEATPAPTMDTSVTLLRHDPTPTASITVDSLAGTYITQAASGITASFTISSTGAISANATDCKLSGQLSAGTMPNTLQLSLDTAACGSLPASSTGFLLVDQDYAPATFRLLSTANQQIIDLWAYAE